MQPNGGTKRLAPAGVSFCAIHPPRACKKYDSQQVRFSDLLCDFIVHYQHVGIYVANYGYNAYINLNLRIVKEVL